MRPKKIAVIFGTRPDTIKLAPIIRELKKQETFFETVTIATAQHRDMLNQVLSTFQIKVDHDLNLMKPRQSLASLTSRIIAGLNAVLEKERPDMVLVQGDTTTTFAGSLAAFYQKIPIGHVEAGLRTNDKQNPFPEEINRRLTSSIAEIHFAPTAIAKSVLIGEGHSKENIFVTGNSVIDALQYILRTRKRYSSRTLKRIAASKRKIILITMHRRENFGEPMREACTAVRSLAEQFPEFDLVFPVHLNPAVREIVFPLLDRISNIHLIEPLGYFDFVLLMKRSHFIITDSGGIQEEAPSLGKPVLVLRTVTERPEAVECGTVRLVGLSERNIIDQAQRLIRSQAAYKEMASASNPYGDGKASNRTVGIIKKYFGFSHSNPKEFINRK